MSPDVRPARRPGPLSDGEKVMVTLGDCWRLWKEGRAPLRPAAVDPLLVLDHVGVEHEMLTRDAAGWSLFLRDGSIVRHDRQWSYLWRRFTSDRLDEYWFYTEMRDFLLEVGIPDDEAAGELAQSGDAPKLDRHRRGRSSRTRKVGRRPRGPH